MTEQKKPSTGFWATAVIVAVVMLPFLYIASLGPLAFLVENGTIKHGTYIVVAYPLIHWSAVSDRESEEWFWEFCNWYVGGGSNWRYIRIPRRPNRVWSRVATIRVSLPRCPRHAAVSRLSDLGRPMMAAGDTTPHHSFCNCLSLVIRE